MSRRWRVKTGDRVYVISGKDKGKTGEIIQVLRDDERVMVKGVNVVKRHTKPSMASAGGMVEKELSIHVSNVMHVDPVSGKPTRVGVKFEDGRKVRVAKRSGEKLDK